MIVRSVDLGARVVHKIEIELLQKTDEAISDEVFWMLRVVTLHPDTRVATAHEIVIREAEREMIELLMGSAETEKKKT